ncbi:MULTISPECIES: diaminobutyrate--2-oxoglutarate transaminase [Spongiibacter]|jgi:diaminobutyrate-2-oxoglutarate transaminase|uniref:diaminobutyrate--2-oxoglutarate transaminase n=1 Tax=Spongiibacter TaxID=630749 RepID=UPI000C09532B|nr:MULTISPECIES: diaminobutyrate--2-oxoglutarate transaminase [Spongiibacter]MAK45405.1 diaminobutyrate--2-oxoglutarate transaminase [Spongiibacter sp.]MBM7422033.1 diaminobutyrate-2-oxoglutarate transaminase [Spongiibacter marinus]MEE2652808.1 diaminobutyrate--2-oxoglutarate transaminase [Pseudomonadota bacterium]|tara:strand:- start:25140 stop:26411 length:1272 start_codon:yes stop_codon:yes gene_type:complete
MTIFDQLESEVQCYARSFPVTFNKAQGEYLYDVDGNKYLDFLAGAGTLNYGHNHPVLKEALVEYIMRDGITHGLDMHTDAKADFLDAFNENILKPRDMEYTFQFTGPTGTNAVEAAMKLARKVTGRNTIVSFTNGFHGVTLGSVAATGNSHHRGGAGVALGDISRMPFCGYHGRDADTIKMMDKLLSDPSSGIDLPAAMLVECVQGEGGLNVANSDWLRGLEKLCRKHDILLIVDDIQAGCGRTGTFFSFEPSGIKPDIVTMSKSLSGYGLPCAIVLLRPDLDVWAPGEHNGTFRGNNHAFVTAAAAIRHFWKDESFSNEIIEKSAIVRDRFKKISDRYGVTRAAVKGRGMMQGIALADGDTADAVARACFERGLVIETCGNRGHIVKCFCPLTIDKDELIRGMDIVADAVSEVLLKDVKKAS